MFCWNPQVNHLRLLPWSCLSPLLSPSFYRLCGSSSSSLFATYLSPSPTITARWTPVPLGIPPLPLRVLTTLPLLQFHLRISVPTTPNHFISTSTRRQLSALQSLALTLRTTLLSLGTISPDEELRLAIYGVLLQSLLHQKRVQINL